MTQALPVVPERADFKTQVDSFHASPHLLVGDTLYCCAVTGWDPDLGHDPPGLPEQIEHAFRNATAILEAAGAGWSDVVKGVSYRVGDLSSHVEPFVKVRDRYVKPPYPIWTAASVTGLPDPSALVQIELTAVMGARR